jgi:hypothetical protein
MLVALSTVTFISSDIEFEESGTAVRNAFAVLKGRSIVANRASLLSSGIASDTSGVLAFVAV